jgi:hypothetical protein
MNQGLGSDAKPFAFVGTKKVRKTSLRRPTPPWFGSL